MPHIHEKPGEHDHTASGFIFRVDGPEPTVLLHLHKKLHCYMHFGGHVELLENTWEAIRHEILEESGYEMDDLHILQPARRLRSLTGVILHPVAVCQNTHSFNDTHSHIDTVCAFTATGPPGSEPQAGETRTIDAFSRSQLLNLEPLYENVREMALFIFDELLPNWEEVETSSFKLAL